MANTWETYPEGPDSEPATETPTSWAVYGDDEVPTADRYDDRPSWKPAMAAFVVVLMVIGFLGGLLSLRPQPQQPVKIEGYARPGLPNVRSVQLPQQIGDWHRGTLTRSQVSHLVVMSSYSRRHHDLGNQDITVIGSISRDPAPFSGMTCDAVAGTKNRRVCVIPLDEGLLNVTSDEADLTLEELGAFTAELATTLA